MNDFTCVFAPPNQDKGTTTQTQTIAAFRLWTQQPAIIGGTQADYLNTSAKKRDAAQRSLLGLVPGYRRADGQLFAQLFIFEMRDKQLSDLAEALRRNHWLGVVHALPEGCRVIVPADRPVPAEQYAIVRDELALRLDLEGCAGAIDRRYPLPFRFEGAALEAHLVSGYQIAAFSAVDLLHDAATKATKARLAAAKARAAAAQQEAAR